MNSKPSELTTRIHLGAMSCRYSTLSARSYYLHLPGGKNVLTSHLIQLQGLSGPQMIAVAESLREQGNSSFVLTQSVALPVP